MSTLYLVNVSEYGHLWLLLLFFYRNLISPFIHVFLFFFPCKILCKCPIGCFLLQDADVMWFRDPFPRFHLDADFQIACDYFFGSSYNIHNRPNGGFTYVKANNRTIDFYKFWHSSRETYPGHHDQDVFNIIKFDPYVFNLGLKMRFLDTAYFGGLCEPSKDLNLVCTMHANCCLGLESKLHDLRIMLQDWKQFVSLPPSWKKSPYVTWRVPENCR